MKKAKLLVMLLFVMGLFMVSTVWAEDAPKRFRLDFVDAYLVYSTSSNSIQIATEGNVLSYGSDWQKVKVKPYLYDLKQKSWKDFYWRVNTSRKVVSRYKGTNFGKIGDKDYEKLGSFTVDVVGDGMSPTRFLLKFKKAYLVYVPSRKTLQIVAKGNVLSYGTDWQKCQLKPYLYELKQNVWKGFFWKINTSRKEAYKVKGAPFCKLGGTETKLKMGVRVTK